jgi:hypothetical protein
MIEKENVFIRSVLHVVFDDFERKRLFMRSLLHAGFRSWNRKCLLMQSLLHFANTTTEICMVQTDLLASGTQAWSQELDV